MPFKHRDNISESEFWTKLSGFPLRLRKLVVKAKTLWHFLKDENTLITAKISIVAALGYFTSPVDLILDLLPGEYVADLLIIPVLLTSLEDLVTEEIRRKSRQ